MGSDKQTQKNHGKIMEVDSSSFLTLSFLHDDEPVIRTLLL